MHHGTGCKESRADINGVGRPVSLTSQQDIHSIGLDADDEDNAGEIDETDRLNQAYDASESAYTLNLDDKPATDE